jgi:hypothetical protein
MAASDLFPPENEIRAANAGLIGVVRDHLPMGFYRGDDNWSLWSTGALARMADTVDSAMALWSADLPVDGEALLRLLYEQVVTFAWIAADPGPRYSRWFGDGLWEDLRMHNDAVQSFGEDVLSDDEVSHTKRLLKLDGEEPKATTCCGATKRRNRPDASLLLPPVPDRAREADEYWAGRVRGLHAPGHPLSLRGLYVMCFRRASRSVHSALGGLDAYMTERQNRKVIARATSDTFDLGAIRSPLRHRSDDRGGRSQVDRTGPGPRSDRPSHRA